MGYRTVVMLNNDHSNEWSKDKNLGQEIMRAMNNVGEDRYGPRSPEIGNGYGEVVECVHADTITLAVLGMYTHFTPLTHLFWLQNESRREEQFRALKDAADEFGYRLVKKSVKEKNHEAV